MKRLIFAAFLVLAIAGLVVAQGDCWLKEGYPIAISEKHLDNFISMIQDEDFKAAQKMIDKQQVFVASKDVQAYMHKIHVFGHDEIRLPGSDRIFWAPSRAISLEKPE
jgi:hypothetical protein